MIWTSLGHACWLIEAAGLRLLCDPLLGVDHHGGVFEVSPRRRLHGERLRPDFILVSHRHPDHFDVPSLARLAELDAHSVVVTPDELVAETARALGFTSVQLVPPGQRVELDGVTLVTTESLAPDEWGVMVATDDGVVWNMVDTVFRDVAHVQAECARALGALAQPRVSLALVQGQPMLEVAAQLGHALSFPFRRYAETLAQLASIDAAALVPSAAGTVHVDAWSWLNHVVYPVEEARFRRDIARLCPDTRVFASQLGARYRLRGGELEREADGGAALIERLAGGPSCAYRPARVPPVVDPEPTDAAARRRIAAWIEGQLGPALVRAYPDFGVTRALRFVVEVVYDDGHDAWTLVVDAGACTLAEGFDPDWDAYDLLVGSQLAELVAGRRAWGDVLLAGALRGFSRVYELEPGRFEQANVAEMFVYYALSYDESTRRALASELAELS